MMPPGLYCVSQDQFPRLKGPYLGQSPPGLKPVIFAPGIVSTERNELNPVFTPDGKYLFFTRNINRSGDIYWVDAKVIETFNPRQK
jgi:Tol biopolymer transport system component